MKREKASNMSEESSECSLLEGYAAARTKKSRQVKKQKIEN